MKRLKRTRVDGRMIDEDMVEAFVDWFSNHETNPYWYKELWDRYREPLMDWWLEDKPLRRSYHCIEHYHYTLEGRLFSRPKLWWVFEATEPMKHYMYTRPKKVYTDPIFKSLNDRLVGFKDEFCSDEDEGVYLIRHGLLSEPEKQAKYEVEEHHPDYPKEEVSRYLKPANATACSHWKCHLGELDWKERLGFAYHGQAMFREYFNLQKFIDRDQYSEVNKDNPYART